MAGQGIERREVLRVLAVAATATKFFGFSRWTFACGHTDGDSAHIRPLVYEPKFFSANEYATIEKLTELIIPSDGTPGAREAGVAEFIDFMIGSDPSAQFEFRTGLNWLNVYAERLHGKAFLGLSREQQAALLETLAFKSKACAGDKYGNKFFLRVRELTVMGFYTSQIGLKELDCPALKFYSKSPQCPHKNDPEHRHLPPPKW